MSVNVTLGTFVRPEAEQKPSEYQPVIQQLLDAQAGLTGKERAAATIECGSVKEATAILRELRTAAIQLDASARKLSWDGPTAADVKENPKADGPVTLVVGVGDKITRPRGEK